MVGQILLKVGKRMMFYKIHMHVDFCCDTIQYGHLAAILFQIFHVLNHNTDMNRQISFKVGIRTMFSKIHMHAYMCCNTIQHGRLMAILLQFFM